MYHETIYDTIDLSDVSEDEQTKISVQMEHVEEKVSEFDQNDNDCCSVFILHIFVKQIILSLLIDRGDTKVLTHSELNNVLLLIMF
jgi:hypothetical protein